MKTEHIQSQSAAPSMSPMLRGSASSAAQPIAVPVLHSQQLFSANNEVLIKHAGSVYRLRITQANKLILTK